MIMKFMNKRRIVIYGGLILLLAVVTGSLYEIESDQFAILAKDYFETVIDRKVEIGRATVNLLGRVTLKDVKVYNPPGYSSNIFLHADKAYLTMGMTGGETSGFRPRNIIVEKPEVFYERPDTRPWNTEDFWKAKTARHDHPTFIMPIEIRNATIHYSDSRVGKSGISLTLKKANISLTVTSDGSEIRNVLVANGVPAVGFGSFDFLMKSHPNARQSEITIQFHEADPRPLKPFYEFIGFLNINSGKIDGRYRLNFDQDTILHTADLRVLDAEIEHTITKTKFSGVSPRFTLESIARDTVTEVRNLKIFWKNTIISGNGSFSNRTSKARFTNMNFMTKDGKAEDISFLLCDPSFSASGPVTGSCSIFSDRNLEKYRVEIDLTKTKTLYGNFLEKDPYLKSLLKIDGTVGQKPSSIDIEIENSKGILQPFNHGWALLLTELRGEDAERIFTFIRNRSIFSLKGSLTGKAEISKNEVDGSLDLLNAELIYPDYFNKPKNDRANLDFRIKIIDSALEFENLNLRLASSLISGSGRWSEKSCDISLAIPKIKWKDAKKFIPILKEDPSSRFHFDGEAGGTFKVVSYGGNEGAEIIANLDLDGTSLDFAGVGTKRIGQNSSLRIHGKTGSSAFTIQDGELGALNTKLSLNGEFGNAAYRISLSNPSTGLDGLKTILASRLWSLLNAIDAEGQGGIEIDIESRNEEMKVNAELDAGRAILSYGDTWYKPIGESFKLRTQLTSEADGIHVERFELNQGNSTLICQGSIGAGRNAPITVDVRANLDVRQFKERAPGLERIKIEGRNAAQALELISDKEHRAAITGRLSGTLEEPKFSLIMERLASRVIANSIGGQIRALGSIISSPLRLGKEIIEGVIGTDSDRAEKGE
ncbi:TPA: hypothetical protein DEF17_02975 [bacterium]|nr:hypothetical protein [bacterium]